jgi:predicted dehydrogenase
MSKPVSIALVGISGFGEWYIRTLLNDTRAGGLRFVAGADPVPHRCRLLSDLQSRDIPVYPALDELLRRCDAELIILSTPIHLHAEQVEQAVAGGRHVLCEKPLAGGLADGMRIVRASRSGGTVVAIGYQWSYRESIQRLKRDILAGRFGRARRLKTVVSFPRGLAYFDRNTWAGRLRSTDGRDIHDSPMNNATAHYLHNMLYLLGPAWNASAEPASVQAELYRANAIENFDTAAVRVVTGDGVEILFFTTHAIRQHKGPQFSMEFDEATVTFDPSGPDTPIAAVFNDGRRETYGNPDADRTDKVWQTAAAVRSGAASACPPLAALPHTQCVAAAQQSMPSIADFPSGSKHRAPLDEDEMVSVHGLLEVFTRCFESDRLPSELGDVPWAAPGAVVRVAPTEAT